MARIASVITMAATIEQAIRPLLLTFSVLGLGIYFPEKLYLSIFYNLMVWIAYGCAFYYIIIAFKREKYYTNISAITNIQINILINITSIIISVYQNKKFRMLIKRLAAVDDTLEELGTPKVYRKLNACAKGVLIGWLVGTNIANINDALWFLYELEDLRCIIIPYIVNYSVHVNTFVDLLFATFLWYIGTRFDKVNEQMKCLLVKEEHGLTCTRRKAILNTHRYITRTDNYKHMLWTSMHIHLELCQIARELNAMFGTQMTMEMAVYMTSLIALCNFISVYIYVEGYYIFSPMQWVNLYFWIFLYIVRLFCLNYICESVSAKSDQIEKIIHQLTDYCPHADVRDEIYQFILQILYHPLKFTGLGLFYFGNCFLRNFFMRITTFVIIIVQTPMGILIFKEE